MRGISRGRILLVVAVALALVLARQLMPESQPPDWTRITVSFGGFTNRSGAPSAWLSIQNPTRRAIKVMDHYYVEWPELYGVGVSNNVRWAAAVTNHIMGAGRRLATSTNLVIGARQTGALLIPVPPDGNHWLVSLEFARANLQTQLEEYLQKPHGSWVKNVPSQLRGFYVVRSASCEFSADAK